MPSVLREEKEYNVFMRCRNNLFYQVINQEDPYKAIHLLRKWRSTGERPGLVKKQRQKALISRNLSVEGAESKLIVI